MRFVRPAENRLLDLPKTKARPLRPYHYLKVPEEDRDNPHLVRERVRCGKPSCGCARDVRRRHGPYWYLRFEESDRRTGQTHYRREYVPRSELARAAVDPALPGRQRPWARDSERPTPLRHGDGFDSRTGRDPTHLIQVRDFFAR